MNQMQLLLVGVSLIAFWLIGLGYQSLRSRSDAMTIDQFGRLIIQGTLYLYENLWVLFLPLLFIVGDYLYSLPGHLRLRGMALERHGAIASNAAFHPPSTTTPFTLPFPVMTPQAYVDAANNLTKIYMGAFLDSRLTWLILFCGALFHSSLIKRLKGCTQQGDSQGLLFFRKMLLISLVILPVEFLINYVLNQSNIRFVFRMTLVNLFGTVFFVCLLTVVSFVEAGILWMMNDVRKASPQPWKRAIGVAMSAFPSLFVFNAVVLSFFRFSEMVILWLPQDGKVAYVCQWLVRFHLPILASVGLLGMPFFIVLRGKTLTQALKGHAHMLKERWPEYLFIVIVGMVPLSLVSAVSQRALASINSWSWINFNIRFLTAVLELFCSAWATFLFLLWFQRRGN